MKFEETVNKYKDKYKIPRSYSYYSVIHIMVKNGATREELDEIHNAWLDDYEDNSHLVWRKMK